ncbi:cytochrome P450 98A3 [Earliella scabrosa]|nr:cytochrome P450 98A3 [Earliella scabrosa]
MLIVCVYVSSQERRRGQALPGPPALPIIGHLLDFPKSRPWLAYHQMCQKYGGLVSLRALGRTLVVIDDYDTAVDLLEKRSAVYSSRPDFKMARLTGWEWSLVFAPYGSVWRTTRRVFWQHFRPDAVVQYQAHQEDAIRKMLSGLLATPENLKEHLRFSLGVSILSSTYGLEIVDPDDENLSVCEEALHSVELLMFNTYLVEYFPWLARVPPWVPGAGYLRRITEFHDAAWKLRNMPWEHAKAALGTQAISAARVMMEHIARLGEESAPVSENVAQNAAAAAYSDVLIERLKQFATMQRFFLAMNLHPDVQKKAQAELDAVVGPNRLPELSDRDQLPYVTAIVKETLRWYPAVPLGVAHCTVADDVYRGFLIPAGATIVVNAWAINHDPEAYADPGRFNPERHLKDGKLDKDARDPAATAFGFGRRICPGRYFATNTMFMFIASFLSVFNISPALDEHGQPITVQPQQTTGIISYLEDWSRCNITPRSEHAETLVRQSIE